jgi:hypothetical protein
MPFLAFACFHLFLLVLTLVVGRNSDGCLQKNRVVLDWRVIAKTKKERENCLLRDSNPGPIGCPTGDRILIPEQQGMMEDRKL